MSVRSLRGGDGERPPAGTSPFERSWQDYIVEEDLGEFPVGWEQRFTAAGIPYYVDHVHRTTTFEDPRIMERARKIQEAKQLEKQMPQHKRDLRRKLLRLRHMFQFKRDADLKKIQDLYEVARKAGKLPEGAPEQPPAELPKVQIAIRRETIFEDSYRCIMKLKPEQLLVG